MRVASLAIAVSALALTTAAPAAAQSGAYKAPRTSFGQPDLGGIWTNKTITPITRPAKYGTRNVLTAEEARALEEANREQVARADAPTPPDLKVTELKNADCGPDGISGFNCGYNQGWKDPGTEVVDINGEKRASIIVSPANGQFPPRKATAQRVANRGARTDNPEGFSLGERCILSFGSSAGPPMLPLMYNSTYNIVQTPDEIAIQVEMVHDVRHIRLNTREHLPPHVKQWMGDSIGWFEGDTLVVETTNFRPEQGLRGGNVDQKVIERFTRIGPDKIHYQFKLEDPGVYEAPIVGELAFNRQSGMIYEYACHEGNYALEGMLAGARAEEKAGRQVAAVEGAEDGEQ